MITVRVLKNQNLALKIAKESKLITFNSDNYLYEINNPLRTIYAGFNDHGFCGMAGYTIKPAMICGAYASIDNRECGLVTSLADCCLNELLSKIEDEPVMVRIKGNGNGKVPMESAVAEKWAISRRFQNIASFWLHCI